MAIPKDLGYSELQRRADARDRNRENHGRMASASVTLDTDGLGVVEFDEPISFDVTFVEEPRVHYGSYINSDDLRISAGLDPWDPLPSVIVSGHVTDWDQDENLHYVGAWVAVTIFSSLLVESLLVTHHFDFHGTGLKVVPHDPQE